MPNYPSTPPALFPEQNNVSKQGASDWMYQLQSRRWYDAMVIESSVDGFANRYTVNVHMQGLGAKPTQIKMRALNLEPTRLYLRGWPCQVILEGRTCVMRAWQGPIGVYVQVPSDDDKAKYPRRVPGWPGDPVLGTYYQQDTDELEIAAVDFALQFTWGYKYLLSPAAARTEDGIVTVDTVALMPQFNWGDPNVTFQCYLGFMWRTPVMVRDWDSLVVDQNPYVSSGILLTGESLPAARTKYQVLSVIDDAGNIAFDYLRFS